MIEDRLKQRLTGAAIVVALMVLLVPEMFRGRPPAAPAAAGNARGPPLRAYTIDLKDGRARARRTRGPTVRDTPALAAPTVVAPTWPRRRRRRGARRRLLPAPGAAAGPRRPAPCLRPVRQRPARPRAVHPPAAPRRPPCRTAPAVPPASPALAPQAAAPVPAPRPAAAAPASPAATPGAGGEDAPGRYQVQLGLFASRANADRLASRAARLGVRATVSGPDARGLYRVHTMTYRSRDDAQAIQQKLRELGLSAALVPQR
ncbi:MAG: SPOR domain-containing protein [Steroidobacteraceae bacterium]